MYQQIRQKINEQCPWLKVQRESLREKLASIEHEQWITWSRALVNSETLSSERIERWKKLWVPYTQLTEEMKDFDRKYADIVLDEICRPPELAELLYAIRPGYFVAAHGGICEYGVGGELSSVAYYDLTKSLRENIESNEELARFLLEVLV